MARVISPLFGMEASGAVGHAIVYDKRGYVRVYTVPANPRTDNQANIRTPFRAAAACVKATGTNAQHDIMGLAPNPYRWSAWIIGQTLGKSLAAWQHAQSSYDNLDATAQASWTTQAQHIHIDPQPVPYDTNPPDNLPGRALWAYATALHTLGLGVGAPASDNAAAWADYIAS